MIGGLAYCLTMSILTRQTATCVRMHSDLSKRIDSFIEEAEECGVRKYSSKTHFIQEACLKLMEQEEEEAASKRRTTK